MAEFVQQSIEEMLPELQQMERVGLFTTEETRQILKRRKRYEYKLRRRTKCKEDFLQYIQYEINALGLVKLRRQKTGYTFKKLEIDIAMVHRIHQLFKLVTIRFKDDVKLWLSHIEFSKQRNEKATVSRLFTDMLQIHNKKPGLWLTAAKWEFEDNANPDNARSLLQRGIRFNSESKLLWLEYYRMELLFTEKMRKRREILGAPMEEDSSDMTDAVLDGSIASVVFQQAIGSITDDVKFILAFIPICQLFTFTQAQEDGIFEHLEQRFPKSELTWSAMAKRCLNPREQTNGEKISKKQRRERMEEHEDRCYKVFDEAVEKIHTELMWTEYLTVCLERRQLKGSPGLHHKRLEKTLDVFKRASNASLLSSELFIRWLELLDRSGELEEAECVSKEATVRFPSNVYLWKCQLSLLTRNLADENQVLQVLNKARKSVIERESWPLWEITLQYLISINSTSSEKQFKICTSSPVRELCIPAKYLYLQWAIVTRGIRKARDVYHSLIKVKPVSVEFYQAFIDIERSQAAPKIKQIRKVFEDALLDFGSDNIDLWLDYIKLEITEPKGTTENAGGLHFRAMKTLAGENVEKFVTQYTLLQTGHEV